MDIDPFREWHREVDARGRSWQDNLLVAGVRPTTGRFLGKTYLVTRTWAAVEYDGHWRLIKWSGRAA